MMLCKLSLKNIKRSFKDYAVYFFTLILGVAIFYVFNAIDDQTVMLDITSSTYSIIELMMSMLSGVSVFVSFVLGFLVIYASRFLIKRRNMEFGIYLTLGMSKRKISMILFLETLFIGIISLFVGLFIGVFLSQFMSMLVSSLFDAEMSHFAFVFSKGAALKTCGYFGVMYIIVMIFNTINISKCKLIDLLQSRRKNEDMRLKNPIICIIVFIIFSGILGYAYYLVTDGISFLDTFGKILIPITMGAISTFFIFWAISGLVLKVCSSIKSFYYKGLNSFILKEFSSKINTTVFSITIICLMLFITICVLSGSLSIKNSLSANIDELAPVDVNLAIKENNVTAKMALEKVGVNINNYLEDIVEVNNYFYPNITMKETLGNTFNEIKKMYPYMEFDTAEEFMSLSDYNKIAKLYNNETFSLKDNEYIIVADYKSLVDVRNKALENGEVINLEGNILKPKYQECKSGFLDISSNRVNSGIIVVSDEVLNSEYLGYNYLVGNYKEKNKKEKREAEEELLTKWNNYKSDNKYSKDLNTKLEIINSSTGLGAMVTFIGIYLGIIFLISSAAILALKQLSDASDNKMRFKILRNLGCDEKDINKALFKEIAIFFLLPLILAIIHSIFGMKFSLIILEVFGTDGLIPSIIMTCILLGFIYGGYFLITYFCSRNIIKERY